MHIYVCLCRVKPVGRLDHGYKVRVEAKKPARPPSEYLKRFYYDAVVYNPKALRFLREMVDPDRIVLGTDYPFDMMLLDLVKFVEDALGADAHRALWENPASLLGKS